jgi:hypothetical protein
MSPTAFKLSKLITMVINPDGSLLISASFKGVALAGTL